LLSTIVLTVIGFLVAVTAFFLISKHLDTAVFWSILLSPAIGSSIVASIQHLIVGDYGKAVACLRYLPCFLASIDEGFFSPELHPSFYVLGALILSLWIYVLAFAVSRPFGIWGLPILPIVIYVAGSNPPNEMGMSNLRVIVADAIPELNPLLLSYYGLPMLFLIVAVLGVISYLIWHRGYTLRMSMPSQLRLR